MIPDSTKEFVTQHKDNATAVSPVAWMKLDIDAPFKQMLEEAKAMKQHFMNHMDNSSDPWYEYGKHQGWFSIDLHNMTDSKLYGHDDSIDPKVWKYVHDRAWTEASQQSPVTVDYFKNNFPLRTYYRLRYMLLEPNGFVEPHSDSQTTNPSFAINISLNNPDGCYLVTEKGTVPFDDNGSVFLFNNYYKHSVINESEQDRFHIILHGRWSDTNTDIQDIIAQHGESTTR